MTMDARDMQIRLWTVAEKLDQTSLPHWAVV